MSERADDWASSDSNEFVEAKKVAEKKLEQLMSDDCTHYALRFMNEGEYRTMVTQGKFESREAWISWMESCGSSKKQFHLGII